MRRTIIAVALVLIGGSCGGNNGGEMDSGSPTGSPDSNGGSDVNPCGPTTYYIFGFEQVDVCADSLAKACQEVCGTTVGCTASGIPILATCPRVPPDAGALDTSVPDTGTSDGSAICGTTPCALDAGAAYIDDAGRRIGANTIDGPSCPADQYWLFPDQSSSYCGSVIDACQYVCGTARQCTIDVIPPSNLQTAYCPGETSPGSTATDGSTAAD